MRVTLKKEMKEANSSKLMYMCSTADIPLKWNDIRNGDITPNWWDMRSIADIPKFYAMRASKISNKEKTICSN
ncbi:hypothetical protein C5S53_12905 [Methanophagales archaeon]|nr:hypothetical protein C5S53_12905 [Methanophagales archaeon]